MTMAKTLVFAEYCVWYVIIVYLHYLHTGDAKFAEEFEPVVDRAMAWLLQRINDDGLIEVCPSDGQTWHTPEIVLGCPTDLNCLMVNAFDCAFKLRQAVGKPDMLAWIALQTRMRDAINTFLWDEKLGVYMNSDAANSVPTQDSNSSAIWAGVASPDRARRALDYLEMEHASPFGTLTAKEDHVTMSSYISPFASFRHLLALNQANDPDGVLRQIRKLWVHMAETDPENVFWEKVSPQGEVQDYGQVGWCHTFTSLCHGWSAGPTYVLTTMLLGVTPIAPGYSEAAIQPRLADLQWADGVVPTPYGGIAVTWQRFQEHECLLRVSLPAGVSAVVAFPLSEVQVDAVEGHLPEKPRAAVPEPGNMLLQGPCTALWLSCALNADPMELAVPDFNF